MSTSGDASRVRQIETLCDRFQAKWETATSPDQAPQIEQYFDEAAEADRPALLAAIVPLDWHYRCRAGERPSLEQYVARFPDHAQILRQLRGHLIEETDPLPLVSQDTQGQEGRPLPAGGPVPRRLGRYEVREYRGHGGGGVVYRGWDAQLQREVAIKVPHRQRCQTDDQVGEFLNEARKLAQLDHPGIVPVYDFGCSEDGTCFVVSRFAAGRDLATAMQQRRFSPVESARLIAQVACALHYAHGRGLVHRDVKPGNILLDENGQPLLADFGLALFEDEQRHHRGEVSGTVAYMAPEQVRGEVHRLDGRCDIWALGVVLYELLTGRRPFRGETRAEVFDEIEHRDPKPLRMIDDAIPADLEQIVLRCLEKRIADRHHTANDLAEVLSKIDQLDAPIGELGETAKRHDRVTRRRFPALQQRGLFVAGAFAVAAVVAIVVGWSAMMPRDDHRSGDRESCITDNGGSLAPSQVLVPDVAKPLDLAYTAARSGPSPQVAVDVWLQRPESLDEEWVILEDGKKVASADRYRIAVRSQGKAWVYVFQIDATGRLDWLFPRNESPYSFGVNPVEPGSWVQIPDGDRAFQLDDNVGVEHIYAVAACDRWDELEAALERAGRSGAGGTLVTSHLGLRTRGVAGVVEVDRPLPVAGARSNDVTRLIQGIDGVLVREIWFRHVAAPAEPGPDR